MKSIIQVLAVLPLLVTSAFAQSPTINCRTLLGTKSVAKVPTSTTTTTGSNRQTSTIVVQPTVTTRVGWVSTSTRTKTKTETTTDKAVTDVFETTTTIYEVFTITNEATVTSTSTSTSTTSTTSTTIVATTQGFKNIRDTLNSQSLGRRAINHPHAAVPEKRAVASGAKGVIAQSYPAAVTCTKTATPSAKTVYTTLRPATKTVAYWLRTSTTTETLTSTSTVVPARVTSTHIDTSISSVQTTTTTFTTEVETSTTTTTSSLPGPTLFDACKPENIFGANYRHNSIAYYASNVVNNGPGVASDFKIMADGASSAVECCAACQNFKTCETYIFRAQNRNCFLLSHDGATCSSQANHPNYFMSAKGSDSGAGYVVGNGNCGYTYSGNSDGSVYTVDGY